MDTNEKNYSKSGMREGNPGYIDPRENGNVPPDKNVSEIEKLEIKESASGRDDSYRPAEEYTADPVSQIDPETKKMNESDSMSQTLKKEFDTDDFNRVDERDQGDSSTDMDAEKSRTGRSK